MQAGGGGAIIQIPSGFNWDWTSEFQIAESGRSYSTNLNLSALANPAGATDIYIDPVSGNDSTGSGTSGSPYKTFTKAITTAEALAGGAACIIYLKAGIYSRAEAAAATIADADFVGPWAVKTYGTHIKTGNKAWITHSDAYTSSGWTQEGSPNTNVYSRTRSSASLVTDSSVLTSHGLPTRLILTASIAACQALPGSYYINGSTVYVHPLGSRAPDSDIYIPINEFGFRPSTDQNFYVENVYFLGGTFAVELDLPDSPNVNTANGAFVDCVFAYTHNDVGLAAKDCERLTLKRCKAIECFADGLNYHKFNTAIPSMRILEIDCISEGNGRGAGTTYNGSTAHDGVEIIRMHTYAASNAGPQIVDTNAGTQSLNLGCVTGVSTTTSPEGSSDSGFQIGDTAEMWLKNCTASGAYYDRYEATGGTYTDLGGFIGSGTGGDGP